MRIFLGFSFREEDKEVVELVGQLIASHFVEIRTGERLGGEQLTPVVQQRIENCDALIGILTRREQIQGNSKWTTHQWVQEEIGWARGKNRKVISLVEQDVEIGGMFQSHEYIVLRKDDPLPAFLALSETIGMWDREIGRTVKIQILPDALARKVGNGSNGVQCRHRLWLKGVSSSWQESNPVPEAGGTFLLVRGVQEDHLIQVQVQQAKKVWQTVATSQWIQVMLKPGGAGK